MAVKSKSNGRTLVTFLLDRTGSMDSVKQETISGFNSYLGSLQQEKSRIDFTLIQFDSQSMDKVCVAVPVAQAPKLMGKTYIPRASTPLIDAAYKTIKAVENQEKTKNAKIVICIQTDGHENASREYTWQDLKDLIAEKQKLGWQFNFMGCGIDAYDQSARMGLSAAQTTAYSPDAASADAVFAASAANTRLFAAGLARSTNYLLSQKRASGDQYFHKYQSVPLPKRTNQQIDLNEPQKTDDSAL